MKNIFCNLQLSHFKHFLISRRYSLSFNLKKCLNSTHECKSSNEWYCKRGKGLEFRNFRHFSTSVKKLEKSTEVSTNKSNNSVRIVYSGSLTYRIKGVKIFTCTTSVGGLIIQPWILQNVIHGNDVSLGVGLLSCVGFFTFVTPFLCHLITKKYVTEIWYDPATDTYTATVLSFFLRKININFRAEDITVPSVPPLFSTMCIKGKPVFIIVDSFLDLEHYIKIMGYDKPMDVQLNSVPNALDKSQHQDKSKVI